MSLHSDELFQHDPRHAAPLAGKVMLVTGASSGIGRAIALEAAGAGADVALTYRTNEAAAREVASLVRARGRRAQTFRADISRDADIAALTAAARDAFGRVDAWVNNAGADILTCCIVAEELAAGDPDVAAVLMETAYLGRLLFDRRMSAEQRERFLPQFLEDDRFHLALATSEPEAETALGIDYHRPAAREPAVKTTATRTGKGEWIINGAKDCVANAPLAKLFAVTVRTEPQADAGRVSTILVPRDAPGLTVAAHDGSDRWFHGACGEVTLRECRVPAQYLLDPAREAPPGRDGEPGREPLAAAINLGIGRAAQEAALDYAQLRVQGGRRIVEHQAIGAKLAEIAIRLSVARAALWQAAWGADHPHAYADRSLADLPLGLIAKTFTAEAVHRAAKDAAECFGAMGVMRDMPLQKYVRDALISLHAGTGNSDAKLAIAEALAGYRRLPTTSMRAAE